MNIVTRSKPVARTAASGIVGRINPENPIPLHVQIERELRRMITLPPFQDDVLIPSEITLANRFGVSRGTMRTALARLADQGLLERKPGVGTRVLTPTTSSLVEWRSFTREMKRRGITVECFELKTDMAIASGIAARALRIPERTKVLRVDRIRGWEGIPVLHSRSWLHPRLNLTGHEDFSRPLYEIILEVAGASAESAREEISAEQAGSALARRLRVKTGTPLLLRRHTVFDQARRPMEFAEVRYVSKRFALTLELRKEQS